MTTMASKEYYKMHDFGTMRGDWPEGYPAELRPLSWRFGAIAGPYDVWITRCKTQNKRK